jgi:spore germination cell wall hydrolase CwlJ-like protein
MAGQMAVAQVTVNRARSGLFPRDLCAVVAQSTIVGSNTKVCQFSWYCDSDLNKARIIKPSESSYIAARRVFLEGQKVAKIDQDVMWFHEDSVKVNPRWPHKVATKIGNHVFYKREK